MAILDQYGRYGTDSYEPLQTWSGSPGDHASARFPTEPPSLARPTPQGRAKAAEGASASPWWARAHFALQRAAPWLFEDVAGDQHLHVPDGRWRSTQSDHDGVDRVPTVARQAQSATHNAAPYPPPEISMHSLVTETATAIAPPIELERSCHAAPARHAYPLS